MTVETVASKAYQMIPNIARKVGSWASRPSRTPTSTRSPAWNGDNGKLAHFKPETYVQ
ncbi:hypothetical protein ACRAWG_28650 [Methylobacterium sp. P31]